MSHYFNCNNLKDQSKHPHIQYLTLFRQYKEMKKHNKFSSKNIQHKYNIKPVQSITCLQNITPGMPCSAEVTKKDTTGL